MQSSDFVHLHVHTQYSLLDGAIRLDDLFRKAKALNMPAVAMTDHGNMFGCVDFYQKARKYGVKPIIGCELYVAPRSRFEKTAQSSGEGAHHLVVLVKDGEGYKNLMKLTSAGYLEGFYYRPRVDKEILAQHSSGLIAMSACMQGEVPAMLLNGDRNAAKRVASEYCDIFGKENFYLEIMANSLPEQHNANRELVSLGHELDIPLAATNDCHYLNREDAEAHEILLCIQTGKTIEDTQRMRFTTEDFYFKSSDEMKLYFKDYSQAISNTLKIAERCNLDLDFDQIFLPHFEIGQGTTPDEYLQHLAEQGLARLLAAMPEGDTSAVRESYRARLESELKIIQSKGFSSYFLIVSDFVTHARQHSIPVGPGRGSAAGSLVAYALGITNIDPIRYGLFFERFLNPDRQGMPDIDIDFCIEGRDDVIKYVTAKYGADNVSQIITFGKMQAKGVIRDVGRALNIPYGEVDRIAKLVPAALGITLDEALQREPRLAEEERNNPQVRKLISLSRSLEGLNRHSSVHAAGVVISDKPLVERVPLFKNPNSDVVTQYSMNDIAKVGLTKFDFLGLKTLTVINNTIRFIRENRGVDLDIDSLSLDDPTTYQLLIKGQTDGVFQLESAGMKDILVNMKPDCIEDIIALIALYRPGPMNMVPDFIARKQGREKITYEVPELEEILKETYGVILYQEQVMQIASAIGGYTLAEADNLRRVMSKKKVSEMEEERPKFLQGADTKKILGEKAKKIWEQMETFAEYGFNKSHSTAYAMISFQTAYLKAHYPVEFMAALLTSEKNNRDNIIKYIGGCSKEMGISVLPPDINESLRDFSVAGDRIRFGLAAVKNVGENAVDSIIEAREKDGRFSSFYDFCDRVDLRKVNKKVFESLIKCGAFDSLQSNRRRLIEGYERVVEIAQKRNQERMSGQISLFDQQPEIKTFSEPELPDVPSWEEDTLLSYEKEMLGFYVTGHPLSKYGEILPLLVTCDSETLAEKKDGTEVNMAGVVSHLREISTRRKETMAYVTLEDMKGFVTVIVFPELYRSSMAIIKSEDPLFLKGKADAGEEGTKIIATEITSLTEAAKTPFSSVHFIIDALDTDESRINLLKALLQRYTGNYNSYLHLKLNNMIETVICLGDTAKVGISEELKMEADSLLGSGTTRFM